MKKMIIYGAGGHGKVIADIAVRTGYTDIVFLELGNPEGECLGFPILPETEETRALEGDKIVAIGNNALRQKVQSGLTAKTLIHPNASLGIGANIGQGSVVMAGAVINPDATIGKGCIINTCASVDHDCVIGDFAHISVGAHVAGGCQIGDRTVIGPGAVVGLYRNIAADCIIGAGAVVIRDITEPGTYVGNPARKIK